MKDVLYLEEELKKNHISNCYVFCGSDEHSIKKYINKIITKSVNKDFLDLNYTEFDGVNLNIDSVINACETLPLMSEKKVVVIYRANFLRDKVEKGMESISKGILQYINNLPPECILIMYYIFENDREKESNKLKKIDKLVLAIKMSKLKGATLNKKVSDILKDKGKDINKADLAMLCSNIENNLDVIENELEKLYCYTINREITTKDILDIVTKKNDNDIFNLVDYISQRKPKQSLDILNELIFKGESETAILRMIQRQFKLLFIIKLGLETGKSKEQLLSELKLNPFICEKMMQQSSKFTLNQLKENVEISLETERILKSKSVDSKLEMELLILKSTTIKM